VFFGNQTLILLSYFTSGYYKFKGIYEQYSWGMKTAFAPESLGHNIAKTSIARGESYFFADLVYEHPSYLFAGLLIAGYAVEFLSVYIIFKPKLHALWGLVLIVLHSVILMTVGPDFSLQLFVLAAFLLWSPFHPSDTAIVDGLLTLLKPKRKTPDAIMEGLFIDESSSWQKSLTPAGFAYSTKTSDLFQDFGTSYPDLKGIKGPVVCYQTEEKQMVLIKSEAIVFLLSRKYKGLFVLRWFVMISPLLSDGALELFWVIEKGLRK
jgi:hypothetical protein